MTRTEHVFSPSRTRTVAEPTARFGRSIRDSLDRAATQGVLPRGNDLPVPDNYRVHSPLITTDRAVKNFLQLLCSSLATEVDHDPAAHARRRSGRGGSRSRRRVDHDLGAADA